ncbi:MAG: UPF0280 family protein [Actinobacteria bacterium]|nr:UPF0280 family protein [Actinomycetota bacterium]
MGTYEPRVYRLDCKAENLIGYQVQIKESDLLIFTERRLQSEATEVLKKAREELEHWISIYPEFYASLVPLDLPVHSNTPQIVRRMYEASKRAGVGPMAAVAGAIAEEVGRSLLKYSKEVIVENGGDIFCYSLKERQSLVYAGGSPFSEKILVKIPARKPVGLCTSSGTVGHSLSFGKADAVVVLDEDTAFADAAATSIGNVVRGESDIEKGLARAKEIGVGGVLIIVGNSMGAYGDIEIDTAV